MAIAEHVDIVRQGNDAITAFRRKYPALWLDLSEASLTGADLSHVDLSGADLKHADLSGVNATQVNLSDADLTNADLSVADLSNANLRRAKLGNADLHGVVLRDADLTNTYLCGGDLNGADLSRANLTEANLTGTNLATSRMIGAQLTGANLTGTDFSGVDLTGADLERADLFYTIFRGCLLKDAAMNDASLFNSTFALTNLAEARGLEKMLFAGSSSLDNHTLRASKGKIPDSFLRGIGFSPWEVLNAKLYDPLLNPAQLAEINDAMFKKLIGNPVGGVFISYSHADTEFVEALHAALDEEEYSVWRDVHDLVAGPLERQVFSAIRINDVVLLVLSENSVNSDWIEAELEAARDKEKKEGRPVLCPITLDDAWKAKLKEEGQKVLWRKVKEKVVLDFGGWDADGFDDAFAKLHKGLPRYYGASKASD